MRTTLEVADFKFGRKRVYAFDTLPDGTTRANLQMGCYALGALEKFGLMADYTHVTMTIIQPFVQHISEYTCTVEELLQLRDYLQAKAIECDVAPVFAPSEDNCHYCKAKLTCKPREHAALAIACEGFEDIDTATPRVVSDNELGSIYAKLGMLSDFCKDVAKRVYSNLMSGVPVVRNDGTKYKLVMGKKGDRAFDDAAAVESLLKSFRVPHDQMYVTKMATLTAIEKLAKTKRTKKGEPPVEAVIGPTQWAKILPHIKQPDGKPSIAHESDPRLAVDLKTVEFDDVEDETDDLFE